jgi:L-serine dehydratase
MVLSLAVPSNNAPKRDISPISVTDLFTVGIGPSSSHTVGPMRAAARFADELQSQSLTFDRVGVELFGSLALTGKGHGTDIAVMLGLSGWLPDAVDPEQVSAIIERIRAEKTLTVNSRAVDFDEAVHILFRKKDFLPRHPNGIRFIAHAGNEIALQRTFYSIGGGAIVCEEGKAQTAPDATRVTIRFPFDSAKTLLEIGEREQLSFAGIMQANEVAWRAPEETQAFVDRVRAAMMDSIERGCRRDGVLPGGLQVRRRASALYKHLVEKASHGDVLEALDWVSLYALAVNEENAAGGRIVTAPTNGAAGIIPAVLKYFERFCAEATPEKSRAFLLTAAAIGILYKKRASISAAEMGCQGEVGVACSMAAGALAAVLGGSNRQVANAAEIGMEHNLGLTCDPIGGLVQIPCIERNTMGAVKAITAARLALRGDGEHIVSLDAVIETMRQTGHDMAAKYKETSLGGLAVNVVEC